MSRDEFEKLYRQHFEPNGDHGSHSLEWVDHPLDLEGEEPHYLVNHTDRYWLFFQAGHAAGLERAADWVESRGGIGYAADIRAMKEQKK